VAPACRPGTAVLAAVVVAIASLLAVRGVARVPPAAEPAQPGAPLIGPRIRAWFRELLAPIEDHLLRWGVEPDAVTYAQLVVSIFAGMSFWNGWMFLAGWLTILAGTLDVLDGGVARRRGVATARGALVDSLVDRYAEFATFLGLGAFFRADWVLLPVDVACFSSLMVSYTRARAESLGVALGLGQVQRPERYLILGTGAWLSDLVSHLACPVLGRPTHAVLAGAVTLLAVLSTATALQRARGAARGLGGHPAP
jgi:CDP-diacylglycerol--glycerol-3-phosphate 3-phosphatidyltransferase